MAQLLTVEDMHILVQQGIQRKPTVGNRNIEPDEIDLQLNRAQFKIIDSVLDDSSKQELADKGFEVSKLNTNIIQGIKLSTNYSSTSNSVTVNNDNSIELTLPTVGYYNFYRASISYIDSCNNIDTSKTADIRLVNSEDVNYYKRSSFYKSTNESFIAELAGGKLIIYPVSTFKSLTNIVLSYISTPNKIQYVVDGNGNYDSVNSIDTNLGANAHYLIVDITVAYLSKIMERDSNTIVNFENEKLM